MVGIPQLSGQDNIAEFQAPENGMEVTEKTIWPFSDYIHRNSVTS
jgi:hypothetical protein